MRDKDQQKLFEDYNPLEDRLGADFFEKLPQEPGIYKMFGRDGKLLYVGKAKNLRSRLLTYRRAKTGTVSRKTVRLIRIVHNIELELCDAEMEALLRENELIRLERPEFNHAKKSPETYYFIHLNMKEVDRELIFGLNMREQPSPDEACEWSTFGAFKGHRLVRSALGGLLRLLYISEHRIDSTHLLPPVLLKNLTPMKYRLPLGDNGKSFLENNTGMLHSLLSGSSSQFFEAYPAYSAEQELLDRYLGKLILEDMEVVRQFFEKCCRRNFEIMQHFGLESNVIPQEKLDDYLVELAFL